MLSQVIFTTARFFIGQQIQEGPPRSNFVRIGEPFEARTGYCSF